SARSQFSVAVMVILPNRFLLHRTFAPRETSKPRACSASPRRYAVIPPHLSDGDEQRTSEPASTDTRPGTRTSRESSREDDRQTQKPQRTNGTRHEIGRAHV